MKFWVDEREDDDPHDPEREKFICENQQGTMELSNRLSFIMCHGIGKGSFHKQCMCVYVWVCLILFLTFFSLSSSTNFGFFLLSFSHFLMCVTRYIPIEDTAGD